MSTVYAQKSPSDTIYTCLATPSKTFYMGSDDDTAKFQTADSSPNFKQGYCCETMNDDPGCEIATKCEPGSAFCATGSRADGADPAGN